MDIAEEKEDIVETKKYIIEDPDEIYIDQLKYIIAIYELMIEKYGYYFTKDIVDYIARIRENVKSRKLELLPPKLERYEPKTIEYKILNDDTNVLEICTHYVIGIINDKYYFYCTFKSDDDDDDEDKKELKSIHLVPRQFVY